MKIKAILRLLANRLSAHLYNQRKDFQMLYRLSILISSILLAFMSGCVGTTPHVQLRTLASADPFGSDSLGSFTATTNLSDRAFKDKVGERIVESYQEFNLSVVEFDDQGKFWNKEQQLGGLHELAQDDIAKKNGAIIVVFAHGWFENADVLNPTVGCFRHLLYQLSLTEQSSNASRPRRIVGVYVGWRGGSQRLPLVKWLTFWNRKETAHKIGRGDMDELMVHLDDLKHELSLGDESPEKHATRLVIVGHSFGGAIMYSALDNILKENTLKNVMPFERGETNAVGVISGGAADLVVLINPAFEALLYSGLAEAASSCTNYNPDQTTILMTIGAENDQATGIAFPVGQFFPALVQNFKPNSEERILNRTSLGHYQRYFDYELSTNAVTQTGPATASQKRRTGFHLRPLGGENLHMLSSTNASGLPVEGIRSMLNLLPDRSWKLEPYKSNPVPPAHSPFLVIAATKPVVDNHTGIWGDTLIEFLRDFIVEEDYRKTLIEGSKYLPKTTAP
jgi:pimeloyl-ACP methyl ester carboxylesterase